MIAVPENIRSEYPFRSHFMNLGGNRLHYVDEGQGEVLLLLHGNPSWSFLWRRLIKKFSARYRVLAIDHMGCGFSDRPQPYAYTLKQHIENLTSFIQKLGLNDITLIVHDWGGAIGMGCAVDHPEWFKRFVVMNTAAFQSKRMPRRIAACRIPVFGRLAIKGFNAFARGATRMACEQPLPKTVKRGFLAPYDSYSRRHATFEFVKDIPQKTGDRSWPVLQHIDEKLQTLQSIPMQLLWGAKDWCFDESFLNEWLRRFPDAKVEVLGDAGHYLLEDAPQEALGHIEHFLNESRA